MLQSQMSCYVEELIRSFFQGEVVWLIYFFFVLIGSNIAIATGPGIILYWHSTMEVTRFTRSSARPGLSLSLPFKRTEIFTLLPRFKKVSMPKGMRYGRSIFLQGLLATGSNLRLNAPLELFNLQQKYHDKLAKYNLDPVHFAVSFVVQNDYMDFILIGVDSVLQLQHILNLDLNNQKDKTIFFDTLVLKSDERWLDPRNWS